MHLEKKNTQTEDELERVSKKERGSFAFCGVFLVDAVIAYQQEGCAQAAKQEKHVKTGLILQDFFFFFFMNL